MPKRTASVNHSSQQEEPTIEKIENEDSQMSKSLKDLIFLGRITSVVKIQGYEFELQTLNTKQQKDIYAELMLGDDPRLTEIKPIVLSRSIKSINGRDFNEVAESEGMSAMDIITSWQFSLIDRLYAEYENMVQESNDAVGVEAVKK